MQRPTFDLTAQAGLRIHQAGACAVGNANFQAAWIARLHIYAYANVTARHTSMRAGVHLNEALSYLCRQQ